ncbi:ABC transporter ATP-binding protein (plasmid) [Ensifer sp. PDNC004]|uniref:ABC transporter ATP-binding protein n=1 Tax=unclassified Ensifer TaxID=2633371 RepID=UPI0017833EC7|nr:MULTISPECIES: ABC transporter ATP-binding protein [unclassified Ensifer]MBD9650541.1 ABC transporter ATP-binding protein [Ensifer sp. ENS09]QRY70829.1 ABC transporter ATP-binding protein [Ensifer sp. PDNC004]
MLEVSNLCLHYGRHVALRDLSLEVCRRETVVILGANGAGKSSLLKAIAGLVRPDAGARITFEGRNITGTSAHDVVEAGIALVPEGRGVFGDLTVEENLALGAYARRARDGARDRQAFVYELFPKLRDRRRQYVNTMSGGEQQMVAIGRALMSKPDLLMLDEPSLGLAPVVVGELFASLGRIREAGLALLIVEQNVKMSLSIADRGYLAEAGRITGEGTAQALMNDAAVQRAFLGAAV